MKYKCIKEMCLPKCDDEGFDIPNEYGFVEIGSEWQQATGISVCGGEVHLDKVTGETEFEWIEISWETLEESFEEMEG